MSTRRITVAVWSVAAWAFAVDAAGQARCAAAPRAGALEEQGLRDRNERHDAAALEHFEQAHALCHTPRALARMALAEVALSRWVAAEEHLRGALADTNDAWIRQRREVLSGELQRAQDHLGSVVVAGGGATGDVWIGDARVGVFPSEAPIRVVAGEVTVRVRAEGYPEVTRTLQVPARDTTRVTITLERPAPPPPAVVSVIGAPAEAPVVVRPAPAAPVAAIERPRPQEPAPGRRVDRSGLFRVWGGATAGASLSLFVATALLHVYRESMVRSTNQAYQTNTRCAPWEADLAYCGAVHQPADDADQTLTPWVVAGYVTAGAFAVTSGILWVIAGTRERAPTTAWQCGGGPGVVGVACGRAF